MRRTIFESPVFGPTTFNNKEFGEVSAAASYGDTRVVIDGLLSINVVETAKFGPQIQLQVFSDDYRVETRNKSRWNRVEIFLSRDDVKKIINFLKCGEVKS